jgi:hypothetical protein
MEGMLPMNIRSESDHTADVSEEVNRAAGAAARAAKFKLYEHSEHHQQIAKLMLDRVQSASIFGKTWKETLGFFAPFGTDNSFWNRFKKSPSFRHLFIFNHTNLDKLHETPLSEVAEVAPISVSDVDSAVNTSALVCALLLGIPTSIMSAVGGEPDRWQAYIEAFADNDNPGAQCSLPYSTFCLRTFKYQFEALHAFVISSFYACLVTLFLAFGYYMCRPSESCNTSPLTTLLEAFTLEVRDRIRSEKRGLSDTAPTTEVSPKQPFDSAIEELEVFMKANFLALTELEEQKNQEYAPPLPCLVLPCVRVFDSVPRFYMWYKSETRTHTCVFVCIFLCVNICNRR